MKLKPLCLGCCGLFSILVATALFNLFPTFRDHQINKIFVVSRDEERLKTFIETPLVIYQSFYFFNVTNAEEIVKGAKPIVQEVGPFIYTESKRKVDIVWDDENAAVTFDTINTYHFQPQLTGHLSENTLITTINPILITLAAITEKSNSSDVLHGMLEMYLMRFNMEPFETHTAGELLFHGYRADILKALAPITKKDIHKTGKFGFLYPTNSSRTYVEKVGTGADDISRLMAMVELDGKPKLSAWKSDECNELKGQISPPVPRPLTPNSEFFMYSAGLCRTVNFQYEQTLTLKNLKAYRFILPQSLMAKSEENSCYCVDEFSCRESMAYLGTCKGGAPMIASYPHFYMGSKEDINALEGLNPIKSKHETYIDIEPVTGLSVRARKRVQIGMPLRHYLNLPSLAEVPEVIFPIFWMEQTADLTDENLDTIYKLAIAPTISVQILSYTLTILGLVLVITAVIIVIYRKKYTKQSVSTTENINMTQEYQKPFLKSQEKNIIK